MMVRRRWRGAVWLGMVLCGLAWTPHVRAQILSGFDEATENRIPSSRYWTAIGLYRDGNLKDAVVAFDGALQVSRSDDRGRGIDSIPILAMQAECNYQLGHLQIALDRIDAAIEIADRRGFPADAAQTRLPNIDTAEITRALATALYRRRVILGDVQATTQFIAVTTEDPIGNSLKACAEFAATNDPSSLNASMKLRQAGVDTNPILPVTLLVAARLLAGDSRFADAAEIAIEAAAAADRLNQPEWIGESLLIAAGCVESDSINGDSMDAVTWQAEKTIGDHLRSGRPAAIAAMLAAADVAMRADDVNGARLMTAQAISMLQRGDVWLPRYAATAQWLVARIAAAEGATIGQSDTIDVAIRNMLEFADPSRLMVSKGSIKQSPRRFATPRLFQLHRLQNKTPKDAAPHAWSQLIRTTPTEWRVDPVSALANETHAHGETLRDELIAMTAGELDPESSLEVLTITDAAMRADFLHAMPLGGRVLQTHAAASMKRNSMDGDSIATRLALDRGELGPTSPPALDRDSLKRLPTKAALLTFIQAGDCFVATLVANGNVIAWRTAKTRVIKNDVAKFLIEIGVGPGGNASSTDWQTRSRSLCKALIPNDHASHLGNVDRIVVVPDQSLWYLPFELLIAETTTGNANATSIWADRYQVSYAPTPGLALRSKSSVMNPLPVGVVDRGLLFPDDATKNKRLTEMVLHSIDAPLMLPTSPLIAGRSLGQTVSSLLVLGVVRPDATDVLRTTPALFDGALPEAMLNRWMSSDANPPRNLFLPGYRTSAVATQLGNGDELMRLMTAFHCSGVDNIVISRWPVGGESTAILFNEFLSELAFTDASAAWTRAQRITRQSRTDPATEPLLNGALASPIDQPPPSLWAGYLIDAGW